MVRRFPFHWNACVRPSLFVLLLTTFVLANSSSAEDKLPAAASRILDTAVREVKKNRDDFTKANEKPLSEARKELEKLLQKLVMDKKDKEAALVLKQIGTLEADVLSAAAAPVGSPASRPSPSPVGKWSWPDPSQPGRWIQLNPNGEARGSWHTEPGLWTQTPDGKLRMMVYKTSREVIDFTISPDGRTITLQDGKVLQRIP